MKLKQSLILHFGELLTYVQDGIVTQMFAINKANCNFKFESLILNFMLSHLLNSDQWFIS